MALALASFFRAEGVAARRLIATRIRVGRGVEGQRLAAKKDGEPFSPTLERLALEGQVAAGEVGFAIRYDDERIVAFDAGVAGRQVARPVLGLSQGERRELARRMRAEVLRQIQRDLRRV